MKLTRFATSLSAALLLAAPSLQATPITKGQTVTPQEVPNPGESANILDFVQGEFSFSYNGGTFSGWYEQGVLTDPFGLTCEGCLDFFYRVELNPRSSGPLLQLGGAYFGDFLTGVAFTLPEIGDSESNIVKTPWDAFRPTDDVPAAGAVLFNFGRPGDPSHVVFGGQTTPYLIVSTNATSYDRSGILGMATAANQLVQVFTIGSVFAPKATQVPEPASLALVASGLVGMFLARRRKVKPAT